MIPHKESRIFSRSKNNNTNLNNIYRQRAIRTQYTCTSELINGRNGLGSFPIVNNICCFLHLILFTFFCTAVNWRLKVNRTGPIENRVVMNGFGNDMTPTECDAF